MQQIELSFDAVNFLLRLSDQERMAFKFGSMEYRGTHLVANRRLFTFRDAGDIFVAFCDGDKDVRMSKSRLSVSHTYSFSINAMKTR